MAIKSQFRLPNGTVDNEGNSNYVIHHFETESAQITDLPDTLAPYIKNIESDGAILTLTKGDDSTVNLAVVANNCGAHNALFRGKDLTDYFDSGEMSKAIAAGTFDDIYPGDFIIKNVIVDGTTYDDVIWIVGDLNYYIKSMGDIGNHVLMFPKSHIGTARMNATDVTAGGYLGSEMWTTTLPKYTAGIKAAFGAEHILAHNEWLTNSVNNSIASNIGAGRMGSSNNWALTTVEVSLFNEPMIYGSVSTSSSYFDVGTGNTQIAAMRHDSSLSKGSNDLICWLRTVTHLASFAYMSPAGECGFSLSSRVGGVRPYFLLR